MTASTPPYEPEGYGIHPARLAFRLASQVKAAGTTLAAKCRAISIVEDRSGRQVGTDRGPVRAGEVVLATNG